MKGFMKRFEDILKADSDRCIREWADKLKDSTESYRRRPLHELRRTCRMAYEANLDYIFAKDKTKLDDFINFIVEIRGRAKFKLSEVQAAFESFRDVTRPSVLTGFQPVEIEEALKRIDEAVSYSIYSYSEKSQKKHEEEIIRMNHSLSQALERIKTEKNNAIAANHVKNEFLANISHELRTPLTSIIGFSKILMDREPAVSGIRDKMKIIYHQGKSLLHIINTLILVSEIIAGTTKKNNEKITIADLLRECVSDAKKYRFAKTFDISFACDEGIPEFIGDSNKLRSAIFEMIYNAIKFSPDNSTIEVECRRDGGSLSISVKDMGIGIEDKELETIFSPFFQVDGSLTREFGGSGLGLTMIRKVAELHNGTVKVESSPKNGSIFTILIPVLLASAKGNMNHQLA